MPGFVAQWGIPADPTKFTSFKSSINDDPLPPTQSNVQGTVSFATAGPNTRTTQLFINMVDNPRFDKMGFVPVGTVLGNGMELISRVYSKYGELPSQDSLQQQGNQYVHQKFPRLSYFDQWRTTIARSFGKKIKNNNHAECTASNVVSLRSSSPPGCDPIVSHSNQTRSRGSATEDSLSALTSVVIVLLVLVVSAAAGSYVWRRVRKEERETGGEGRGGCCRLERKRRVGRRGMGVRTRVREKRRTGRVKLEEEDDDEDGEEDDDDEEGSEEAEMDKEGVRAEEVELV